MPEQAPTWSPSRLVSRGLPRRLAATIVALAAVLVPASVARATTTTFASDADAYVAASSPKTNYGGASVVRGDLSPRIGYVRFTAKKLTGTVTKATLRLWSTTANLSGFDVRPTAATSWSEGSITYNSRPAVGATSLAKVGSYAKGQWVALDVTPDVTGNGAVTLAIVTSSVTSIDLASREAGSSKAPNLVVETTVTAPPPPPPPPPPATPPPAIAVRPYDARSAWNTPIPAGTALDPKSATYVNAIKDNNLPLTSDPDQYAIPVYRFDATTPRRSVAMSGYYSTYDAGDDSRVGHGFAPTLTDIPIPDAAVQSAGSDGQIVLWDPVAGTEYSFWQFARDASGNYSATNGARYHTTAGYFGRFADGLTGRGDGTPYLAGLVQRAEIDQGHIDHALAFAFSSPASTFVYPASKSDGSGVAGTDPPEGARLQLDPSLTDADFTRWGLSAPAKIIARALQTYGMYVVDNSGSSKIYLEDRITAKWDASIDRHLTENIPWTSFRVVAPPAAP